MPSKKTKTTSVKKKSKPAGKKSGKAGSGSAGKIVKPFTKKVSARSAGSPRVRATSESKTGSTTKKASAKKRSVAKKKTTTKKKPATKKVVFKKRKKVVKKPAVKKKVVARKKTTGKRPKRETLFILSMNEPKKAKKVSAKSVKPELPALDLDKLSVSKTSAVSFTDLATPGVVSTVTAHQQVSFYMGVFFGVIVVHVFLVTALAVQSL